jgi:hypothetical protein
MKPFIPQLKDLGECAPGELVRLQVGNETRWGIKLQLAGPLDPMLVLSDTEIKTVDIPEQGGFDQPVLSYGKTTSSSPITPGRSRSSSVT